MYGGDLYVLNPNRFLVFIPGLIYSLNETPRRKRTGYHNGLYFISPQGAGNITHEILRLRSGSVRLINFVSQNQSLTDLITRLAVQTARRLYTKLVLWEFCFLRFVSGIMKPFDLTTPWKKKEGKLRYYKCTSDDEW